MMSFEWRELEAVIDRLRRLRREYEHAAAKTALHHGLIEGLKKDMAEAGRVRDQLIHHISSRLGAVAAHRRSGRPSGHQPTDAP